MKTRRIISGVVGVLLMAAAGAYWFVRTHPLVFLESFWGHEHCMKAGDLELRMYAADHGGRFPYHTNGYGDALLLVEQMGWPMLTGPGYTTEAFEKARTTGSDMPEAECGRVYVQGLWETNDANIAILFDKLPTPGGDHTHGFARLRAPLLREVGLIDGSMQRILERDWPEFSRKQIELLVKAGIPRAQAEGCYAEKAKPELLKHVKP